MEYDRSKAGFYPRFRKKEVKTQILQIWLTDLRRESRIPAPMRIWLIKAGEPLPLDPRARMFRTGTLAACLEAAGHEVVWWSSTFAHIQKRHLFPRQTAVSITPRYRLHLLHGVAYRKNLSLLRMWNHREEARAFLRWARTEPPPDILLSALPTLDFSAAAARYARERGVPLVVDVRDPWPDMWLDLLPAGTRWLGRLMTAPAESMARAACAAAAAITGVSAGFVEWGVRRAGRKKRDTDRCFPHAYPSTPPSAENLRRAELFWDERGVRKTEPAFRICFLGRFGFRFDLKTVLDAARILEAERAPVQFVLCGSDAPRAFPGSALGNVLFPGWVGEAEMWTLLRRSSAGLAPYRSTPSFEINLPSKPVEYLSAGLPVLTSLDGDLRKLLEERGCGVYYPDGDGEALALKLRDLIQNPDRREILSRNARALYRERFVAENVYGEMVRYLEEMAGARKSELMTVSIPNAVRERRGAEAPVLPPLS